MPKNSDDFPFLQNFNKPTSNALDSLQNMFSITRDQKIIFESLTSSLAKQSNTRVSVEDAKKFSIQNISNNLTKVPDNLGQGDVAEINAPFKFLARVDTSATGDYNLDAFAEQSLDRNYLSYSVITDKNISHYKTNHSFLLAYNMPPEAIVHVFPVDSDTNIYAKTDDEVSGNPSMWLTLDELCEFSDEIGVYNQITCRTQVDGKPIFPSAILVFDKIEPDAEEVAEKFGLPIIVSHPQKNAICYVGDSMMINRDKASADKYQKMVEVFKSRLRKYFKTRNEKRVFEAFIESFQPELMNLMSEFFHK